MMADQALEGSLDVDLAVERFSAGIDRLLTWLPEKSRAEALELARAHGYSTSEQIARLRAERKTPN